MFDGEQPLRTGFALDGKARLEDSSQLVSEVQVDEMLTAVRVHVGWPNWTICSCI